MNKVLVIGVGSIGTRYSKILQHIGYTVYFVTKRKDIDSNFIIDNLNKIDINSFELILITNETYKHLQTLNYIRALGYRGNILLEKPLDVAMNSRFIDSMDDKCFIGYNLRFHPIISRLKEIISKETVYSCQLSVGQYLPSWRDCNYRDCYSSHKNKGGGVLRDLSHELDLSLWFFGDLVNTYSNIRKNSILDLDVEDSVDIISIHKLCKSVSIHLDYTSLNPFRTIRIQTEKSAVLADLIENKIYYNNEVFSFNIERDFTYRKMLESIFSKDFSVICSFKEAKNVMNYIAKVEDNQLDR